jgi:hypothetical protein
VVAAVSAAIQSRNRLAPRLQLHRNADSLQIGSCRLVSTRKIVPFIKRGVAA